MNKTQAKWVRKQFNLAKADSDAFMIDDGAVLTSCGEGPDGDVFYACWDDDGDQCSCHIPESSFLPENNPFVNRDGNFELKDNKGYDTIIAFFKLKRITPKGKCP